MLLLATLIEEKHIIITLLTSALLAFAVPILRLPNVPLFVISFVISLMIFLKILQSLLELYIKTQYVNLFLILLLLDASTTSFKLLAVVLNFNQGVISYHIGAFVQLFFGVAFWFVNINTKNIKIPIKGLDQMK
jgi:hypothetical protein